MNIRLYQIDPALDTNRLKGYSLDIAQKVDGNPDPRIYKKTLEIDLPVCKKADDLRGSYVSIANTGGVVDVSDVLVLDGQAFYVEPEGFSKINFPEYAAGGEITGIMLEPEKSAYQAKLTEQSLAELFGSYPSSLTSKKDTTFIGSGVGELNRKIDGVVQEGPIFICGSRDDGSLQSLTEDMSKKYLEQYADPEIYTYENEGNSIIKIDYHDKEYFDAVSQAAIKAGFEIESNMNGMMVIKSGDQDVIWVEHSGAVSYIPSEDGVLELVGQIYDIRDRIPIDKTLEESLSFDEWINDINL